MNPESYQADAEQREGSLTQRVLRGGIWIFSLRLLNNALAFVRKIVLARLLTPNDFGLMGVAVLAMATLETFSETGIHAALIRKKENITGDLDTAWTITALRGAAIFLILVAAAPLIAGFFGSPDATAVVRVIGLSALLTGLRNSGVIYFQKELNFRKQFLYEFTATLATMIVSIVLAVVLRSVWALVWGSLAAAGVRLVSSYLLHPYRPRLRLNMDKAGEMLGFGKWLLVSGILVFLINQGDDIFVGKMLGVVSLGYYQMAFFISNMPSTEITNIVAHITYPAYSRMNAEIERIRSSYRKVLLFTMSLSMPLAGAIYILSEDFIRLFLGDKWQPVVSPIHILVFAGLIRSVAATTGPIFKTMGHPQKDTLWQSVRLVVLAALIFPFTARWGIEGVCAAVLISISVSTFGFLRSAARSLGIDPRGLWSPFFVPAAGTILMVITLWAGKITMARVDLSRFGLLIAMGMLSYLLTIALLDKVLKLGLMVHMREAFHTGRLPKEVP